jgi:RNA polymerase sigma factor FliA
MQSLSKTLLTPIDTQSETDQILIDHLYIVRSIAKRIHRRLPQTVDLDDLYAAGLMGLTEAAANFNPEKNSSFIGYAHLRIQGAILDSLRSLDWAPRTLRRKGRQLQEAAQVLTSRLGHLPTDEDVAAELKISLETYHQLRADLNALEIGTLHRTLDEDTGEQEIEKIPGRPEDDSLLRYLQGETKEQLTKAIKQLSERERLIITSYYYEEMTMTEIGLTLGIKRSRVRHIHSKAVLRLRSALSDPLPSGRSKIRFGDFVDVGFMDRRSCRLHETRIPTSLLPLSVRRSSAGR